MQHHTRLLPIQGHEHTRIGQTCPKQTNKHKKSQLKGVLSKSSNLLHCNIKQDLLRPKGMRTPWQKQEVEKIVNKEENFSANNRFVTSNHLFPSRADAQVAKLILVTTSFQSFQDLVKFSSVTKSSLSFLQLLSRPFHVSRQLFYLLVRRIHGLTAFQRNQENALKAHQRTITAQIKNI